MFLSILNHIFDIYSTKGKLPNPYLSCIYNAFIITKRKLSLLFTHFNNVDVPKSWSKPFLPKGNFNLYSLWQKKWPYVKRLRFFLWLPILLFHWPNILRVPLESCPLFAPKFGEFIQSNGKDHKYLPEKVSMNEKSKVTSVSVDLYTVIIHYK